VTTLTDKQTKAILKELGLHIRNVRKSLGIQQAQLAKSIGMDPTNLAKVERGERNLTLDTVVRIAHGLDARLDVKLVPKMQRPR